MFQSFRSLLKAPSLTRGYASVASVRKTVKPIDSRKTYLIDFYTNLMRKNSIVLFAHRNNLVKADDNLFREQINKAGGSLVAIKNSIMKVYLRSENELDPALKENCEKNLKKKHPLFSLLNSPTSVITIKENDPKVVKELFKVLKSAKERLFIVGAKVDADTFNLDDLTTYRELPNKQELQAQLVGLLSMSGGLGLTRTLEAASNSLYLTLKTHHDNIENPKSEQEIVEETKN